MSCRRSIFPVMVDTGIDQNPFEPTFQGHFNICMPTLIKLANIFKKLHKPFVHDFFGLFSMILIAVTNFHSIISKELIQFLLATAVIFPATHDDGANLVAACDQCL